MKQHNTTNYKEINKHIIEEMKITKDLSKNTIKSYTNALNQYSTHHQQSIQQLLEEADNEEEQRIRLKHRKIKQRLLNFRQHLITQGKQPLTVNTIMNRIIATYHFYEIETPRIPSLINTKHELIEDIPTKEHIRTVLQTTNNIALQALILFMSSSGSAKNETLSITIQDFINATREYHNEVTIENVIQALEKRDDVVPTFQLYRKKTHYPYITFCTPEATKKIVTYLKYRIHKQYPLSSVRSNCGINPEDKLFHFQSEVINKHFIRLNDRLGWGWKGSSRFFHPHALRKFFATELLKSDMDSMTIDFLSGRKISKTHEAYFKADPQKLKQKYMHFMKNLMINQEVEIKEITPAELKELDYYRERDKKRDEKIRKMELLLQEYMNSSA